LFDPNQKGRTNRHVRVCAKSHTADVRVRFTPKSGHSQRGTYSCLTQSELLGKRILNEIVEHPVGLMRRRSIKLGDAFCHCFFLGKRM